ncbi:hypothetical protein ACSNOB_20960 [Micromonospora sp. URMC 106]|uniref:hypothetical protein n=1 Tax=Micromonospora sp. URMC 106 TaxID=3423408 RepID=UPI003F19D29E
MGTLYPISPRLKPGGWSAHPVVCAARDTGRQPAACADACLSACERACRDLLATMS